MNEIRYGTPIKDFDLSNDPRIFLAGPTVRGHQQHLQPSWRFDAIKLFREKKFEGSLIIPEFQDLSESDKGRYDLPLWEYEGLKIADSILFWVPRSRELIGLTTNFELGYWMKDREKLVYGRPDDAYRIDYLDIIWNKDYDERSIGDSTIYNTLEETVEAAIKLAKKQVKSKFLWGCKLLW